MAVLAIKWSSHICQKTCDSTLCSRSSRCLFHRICYNNTLLNCICFNFLSVEYIYLLTIYLVNILSRILNKDLSSLWIFFFSVITRLKKLFLRLTFVNLVLCVDFLLMKSPFFYFCGLSVIFTSVLTLLSVSLSGHPRGSREVDDRHHQRDHPSLSFPGWDQILLYAALSRGQTPHWVGTNLNDQTWV